MMPTSLELIVEANNYIDGITSYSPERLEALDEYRQEMTRFGFDVPFAHLLKITESEVERGEQEFEDQRKQARYIKELANMKRFALHRVKLAISCQKIGEMAGESALLSEILGFLPYDGNFIGVLAKTGTPGVMVYRELSEWLKQASVEHYFSAKILKNGKPETHTIAPGENATERLKELGGELITLRRISTKQLISNKMTRIALVTAVVASAHKDARRQSDATEKKDEQLSEYNKILSANGITRNSRIDSAEGFEKVKNELTVRGFMLGKKLVPELELKVNRARKEEDLALRKKSIGTLLKLLVYRYVSGVPPEFPDLAKTPDLGQLVVIDTLYAEYAAMLGLDANSRLAELVYKKLSEYGSEPVSATKQGGSVIWKNHGVGYLYIESPTGDSRKLLEELFGETVKFDAENIRQEMGK